MLVELQNVTKHYDQFDLHCSMQVQEGCVTGLIGQNGAGKSTTFKAILDLIKVDSGSIKIFNKETLSIEDKENIGVVLSDGGFSEYLTIVQIIPILQTMYKKFNKSDFIKQCQKFQLPLDKTIKEYSTGMKAKLKVLIAISHQAKLLILDEPTAGLDVIARDEILDILRDYMSDDTAILISSHISSDLEGLCDDIYMIDKGNIILHEETDVLLDDYGLLKLSNEQYQAIDKQYMLRTKKESFGYSCLTNQKQFYLENYPMYVIEKSSIDTIITMMIRGDK